MGGNADSVTVSGFSSGAGMASSMHVIYSDTFKGAGILSGGNFAGFLDYYEPYDPDAENPWEALQQIWEDGYDETYLNEAMASVYSLNLIDDPSNLEN
jgi:poly(3-hydroxybutyrate) depolymerase